MSTLGGRAEWIFSPTTLVPKKTFYDLLRKSVKDDDMAGKKLPFVFTDTKSSQEYSVNLRFRLYGKNLLAIEIKHSEFQFEDSHAIDYLEFQDIDTRDNLKYLLSAVIGLIKNGTRTYQVSADIPKVFSCLCIVAKTEHLPTNATLIEAVTRHKGPTEHLIKKVLEKNTELNIDAITIFVDRQGIVATIPEKFQAGNRFTGACNILEVIACIERMSETKSLGRIERDQFIDLEDCIKNPSKRFVHSTSSEHMWKILASDFELSEIDWASFKREVLLTPVLTSHRQPRKILIFTAFDQEAVPVKAKLSDVSVERIDTLDGLYITKGTYAYEGYSAEVYIFISGVGNTPTALVTSKLIHVLKPELTVFCGIAGGRKETKIGDVVVASRVYNYESGKEEKGFWSFRSFVSPRPREVSLSKNAESLINAFMANRLKNGRYDVYFKPIACGEKVLGHSGGISGRLIKGTYGDALAIEMEGFGFLSAVDGHSSPGVLIRGISDCLDNKSEEENHELATENASDLTFELVKFFLVI